MVAAITMVRDEADIAPYTVAHMLHQVDVVIVADNGSSDGTRRELEQLLDHGDLQLVDDPDPAYFQSRKMTALAAQARDMGADWVVPFDADELWLTRDGRRIADVLCELPESVLVARADLWDHVATAQDPPHPNPIIRLGWRRGAPAPLPKVAVRARDDLVIAQGNHSAAFTCDTPGTVDNLLTIRHFPYRAATQTITKVRNGAAAYAATDLPEEQGAHWRGWGRILDEHGEDAIADLFRKWHWRAAPHKPLMIDGERQPALIFDPAPALWPSPS